MRQAPIPDWARQYNSLFDNLDFEEQSIQEILQELASVVKQVRATPCQIPKVKKERVQKVPFGTYGKWDYPNQDWAQEPTLADVPEICAQKRQRDPKSKLWRSHEMCAQWLQDRASRLAALR